MEIKTEADCNYITECLRGDKSTIGMWRNIESIPFYSIYGRINLQLEPMGFPV